MVKNTYFKIPQTFLKEYDRSTVLLSIKYPLTIKNKGMATPKKDHQYLVKKQGEQFVAKPMCNANTEYIATILIKSRDMLRFIFEITAVDLLKCFTN